MSKMVDVLIDSHNDAHGAATSRAIAALTPPPPVRIQPTDHGVWLALVTERLVALLHDGMGRVLAHSALMRLSLWCNTAQAAALNHRVSTRSRAPSA